jgi:MoxR-like ATPase
MRTTADESVPVSRVLDASALLEVQNIVRKVPISRFVTRYAVTLVRNSRPGHPESPKFVNEYVSWGGGPRASQYLILAGKARALLQNRFHVSVEDIGAMAAPVLRHRLVSSFAAEAENVPVEDLVRRLLECTRVPEYV